MQCSASNVPRPPFNLQRPATTGPKPFPQLHPDPRPYTAGRCSRSAGARGAFAHLGRANTDAVPAFCTPWRYFPAEAYTIRKANCVFLRPMTSGLQGRNRAFNSWTLAEQGANTARLAADARVCLRSQAVREHMGHGVCSLCQKLHVSRSLAYRGGSSHPAIRTQHLHRPRWNASQLSIGPVYASHSSPRRGPGPRPRTSNRFPERSLALLLPNLPPPRSQRARPILYRACGRHLAIGSSASGSAWAPSSHSSRPGAKQAYPTAVYGRAVWTLLC